MSAALPVDWAVASRAVDGQLESGDLHVVEPFSAGVLLGVIDGLGHGAAAAEAARLCAAALREDPSAAVDALFQRCDERLRHTRGVVMTLASLEERSGELTWGGVGNVEAMLCRPAGRDSLTLWNGFVGNGTCHPRLSARTLARGDVLLFASDGIRPGFGEAVRCDEPVQAIADGVLAAFQRENDDALVLVARWQP
jgi:hypothetical protein